MVERNRIAALDGYNVLYKAARQAKKTALTTGKDVETEIVKACTRAVEVFQDRSGYEAVLVLDGKAPVAKQGVVKERRRKIEAAKTASVAAERGGDVAEARKQALNGLRIAGELKQDVLEALEGIGVGVFQAPAEAEAQAAYWQREGQVAVVVSEDFDAFLYGAKKVLPMYWRPEVQLSLGRILQKHRAYNRLELIDATILAGKSDYAPRFPGVKTLQDGVDFVRKEAGLPNAVRGHRLESAFLEARRVYTAPMVSTVPLVA